jgi:penicillin-binding protein 2
MLTDWQELSLARTAPQAVVDPRRRMSRCVLGFTALALLVWCRAVQLEICQGAAFRAEALRASRHEKPLPAPRGRILARDGTVLACDREVAAIAVNYRYLEQPPRQDWLKQLARRRLPPDQRRDAARLAEEVERVRQERDELHVRLAALCKTDITQWQARARKIQDRVERIADGVRRRRLTAARLPPPSPADESWADRFSIALDEILGPARDVVPENSPIAEEIGEHVVAEDIPASAAAEIELHGDRYPGAHVVRLTRRTYPCGALAGHVLGYLGPPAGNALRGVPERPNATEGVPYSRERSAEGERIGLTGIEQTCDASLHGRPGLSVEMTDHSGRVLQALNETEVVAGRDVTLTIDTRLQRTAEELLDSAVERATVQAGRRELTGGAVLVMDIANGEILAAASAPRFDPNLFVGGDSAQRQALLRDPAHPLFHRAIQMSLPPGSVFKTVSAIALLESAGLDPAATFYCQGYLKQPDRQRCEIYVRHGTGHGEITLAEALAESCNVYFFHHAEKLPPETLVDWTRRLGFGQLTGVDLPGEAKGKVPVPRATDKPPGRGWKTADTQAMSIGQGALTATPIQVVRMMAAVANGGLLVKPHVVRSEASPGNRGWEPQPVAGLSPTTLTAVRAGLLRTVTDPQGTAHGSLYLEQISIAGKTGTAETAGQPDHAWFAGYVPADRPRYAMVVVLEQAGDAATAACPVAKRLVLRMLETGLLRTDLAPP